MAQGICNTHFISESFHSINIFSLKANNKKTEVLKIN